jgi:ADP-ribose pyrophosphatase YjhB (NUDIX family)
MARKTVFKVRALVTDEKGRVYAIRANDHHVLQLPGGSRKEDENPRKALRREIREELGFTVRILSEVATVKVKRNGTREITTFYRCEIKNRKGAPKLTARESRRGLRVKRYENVNAFCTALSVRVTRYGRSACIRDHKLTMMTAPAV